MADVRAFRAFRYDLGRVGALSDVVAPPYDVIDCDLQQELYEKSQYNVVRLILNKEESGDTESNNRYTRAAGFLRDWQRDGVVVQDSAQNVYVYHQEFEVEGKRFTRKGFLARVHLEILGQGRIYAHEETMPGPKADRLRLFHATGMNLSPVFGLYPDTEGELQGVLDKAVQRLLPLEARDHLGVVSRLWAVADQKVISAVTGLMGPKPIFIADGHHRYETSLRYFESCRHLGEAPGKTPPASFALMMLVSMQDPGLVILPTHRLISGLPRLEADKVRALLDDHFDLELMGHGEAGARDAWELIESEGGQGVLGFGTVADGCWFAARFRKPEAIVELASQHSAAWRQLAVSVLHVLVVDRLLPQALGCQPHCRYVHLLRDVTDDVAAKNCQLAVLVPPARMRDVEQIAGNLEKMPPKSTYFYPKLLSGLVFNSLKKN